MAIEFWMALGASLLLAIAAIAEALRLFRDLGLGRIVAFIAECGATVLLLVALILGAIFPDAWPSGTYPWVTWGLALASLAVHLLLGARDGAFPGRLALSLIALALVLIGVVANLPASPLPDCIDPAFFFYVKWTLLLVGAGSAVVAGSAGLEALLYIKPADPAEFRTLLARGTMLALVALGAGLTLALGWVWRATGRPLSGDPRESWLVVTWLIAAASLIAWQLEKRAEAWAGALATLATAVALVGLILAPALA